MPAKTRSPASLLIVNLHGKWFCPSFVKPAELCSCCTSTPEAAAVSGVLVWGIGTRHPAYRTNRVFILDARPTNRQLHQSLSQNQIFGRIHSVEHRTVGVGRVCRLLGPRDGLLAEREQAAAEFAVARWW